MRTMTITRSSGNVYADIGVAQPEAMLAKAQLAQRVGSIIAARKLTQREGAEIIGVPQPKLSKILRGQFRGVSEAKARGLPATSWQRLADCYEACSTEGFGGVVVGGVCIAHLFARATSYPRNLAR